MQNKANPEPPSCECFKNIILFAIFCTLILAAIITLSLSLTSMPWCYVEYKIPQTNTTVRDEMGATTTCTTTTKTVSNKKKSKRNCTDSWRLLETADKIGVISLSIATALLEIALFLTMLIGCRWYGHLLDFYYTVIRLTHVSLVIGILGIVFALYDGRLGKRSDVTWEQAEGQSYLLIGAMTTTFADLAASLGMHYHKLWIYIFGNVKLASMQQS